MGLWFASMASNKLLMDHHGSICLPKSVLSGQILSFFSHARGIGNFRSGRCGCSIIFTYLSPPQINLHTSVAVGFWGDVYVSYYLKY